MSFSSYPMPHLQLKYQAPSNEDDMASDKYFEEPGDMTEELEEAPEMNVPAAVSAYATD